jgi:site-specific recombinase XerD
MFDHILEDYFAQLTVTGRSHATQRAVRSDLTQFCIWWEHTYQRPFDLTQVVERDLRAWKVGRQQADGAAPATINRGLSTLRRLCAWAMEQKRLAENPTRDLTDIPSKEEERGCLKISSPCAVSKRSTVTGPRKNEGASFG